MHPQQDRLLQAANAAGIQSHDLSTEWQQDAVRFSFNGKTEVIFEGTAFGTTSQLATTICQDLPIMKAHLRALEIPCADDFVLKLEESHATTAQLSEWLGAFWVPGKTYSCRPRYATDGQGLAQHLRTISDLEAHLDTYADAYATWVIEAQLPGDEVQLLVVGGKLIAAIQRSPLKLAGNGSQTLEELIDAHNVSASPANTIEINAETRQLLRDQSIYLSEIVPLGMSVMLKTPASGGGDAQDITSRLHARYAQWVQAIVGATAIPTFVMDCRTTSVEADPHDAACVMGLDCKPEWLPFEVALQGNVDIASMILRAALQIEDGVNLSK